MDKAQHKIRSAIASVIDAINALQRCDDDECKEKLKQAERSLRQSADAA